MNNIKITPYIQDILSQPQALQATLTSLMKTADLENISKRLASGNLHHVLLTGMGSSHHALYPLMYTLIDHGLSAQMIETSELIHYAPHLIKPGTLLVVVSQSGESVEILRLLELNQSISPLIAVTNSSDGLLAKTADITILTIAGVEHSVSCKTYVTAIAVLAWLGDILTSYSSHSIIDGFHQVSEWIESYLSRWKTHVETLEDLLASVQHLILVGRGVSLSAVYTGGLIIKEAARFHAEGMSSAAFRHGPLEMISPDIFVLVYTGDDRTAKLNERLSDLIQTVGGRAQGVSKLSPLEVFHIPNNSPVVLPILEILPAQMITLALAKLQGIQAGHFEIGNKLTTEE
jgi:glucosamine--fructose-6-phosphate aminotransferase (isomerizing)